MTSSPRPDIAAAARVVVKVGSSSLTTEAGEIADEAITALAAAAMSGRTPASVTMSACQPGVGAAGAVAFAFAA